MLTHSPRQPPRPHRPNHPVWLLHGPSAPQSARRAGKPPAPRLIEMPRNRRPPRPDRRPPHPRRRRPDPHPVRRRRHARGRTRRQRDLSMTSRSTQAGCLIGARGHPSFGALDLSALADAPGRPCCEARTLGPDMLHPLVDHLALSSLPKYPTGVRGCETPGRRPHQCPVGHAHPGLRRLLRLRPSATARPTRCPG